MPPPPAASRRLHRSMLAAAVLVALAAVPGAWVRSTHGARTAADEPQYLLTTISLAEDGDLDIADELAAGRWRAFHEAPLPQQTTALEDGRRLSPHDPLLPALLAGPWLLGGWLGARLALAVVAGALAAAMLWTAVRRLGVPLGIAAAVAVATGAAAPLLVYGSQLYPELPAALAVTAAVAAGLGPPRRRSSVAVVVAVVCLPWLAVKYVPVAATLALVHLARVWRSDRRHAAWIAAAYAIAGVAYVGAHLAWYGGVTVYATGDFFVEHGGQASVFGTEVNLAGRSQRLIGLLVDRGFGIAAWQPAWLALVPATAWALRRRPAAWHWLVLPLAVGWLNATFVAVTMHGWWFPGRQVVHVLPLAALLIARWVAASRPAVRGGASLAAVLGLWTAASLVVDGLAGRLTWAVDFTGTGNPWYRLWRHALPDYLSPTTGTWVAHAVWLVVFAGAAWMGARQPPTVTAVAIPSSKWDSTEPSTSSTRLQRNT